MMSKVLVTEDYLQDIADAIREKVGNSATYTPAQMGDAIRAIPSGGGGGFDPSEFTKYLQSDGASWIDTGYYPKSNSRFELIANVDTNNPKNYTCPFGTRQGTSGRANEKPAIVFLKYGNANKMYFGWGTDDKQIFESTPLFGKKCKYELSASKVSVIDEDSESYMSYPFTGGDVTDSKTMYLFVLNNNGNPDVSQTICTMKMYEFRIYEGDTLVMNLVPFMDGSTPCLKDTISGNLFYNAGTGSFTYGEDA